MSLDAAGLQSDLDDLAQADSPSDRNAALDAAAAAWADAIEAYASGIVPPSTTVTSARATFQTAMQAVMRCVDPATTVAQLEAAFLAFATSVGAGMTGFVPTPPPGPVGFAALGAATPPTFAAAAATWAAAIDTWFHTGTATLVAPPNTLVPWS
jgi:hypothetical protein